MTSNTTAPPSSHEWNLEAESEYRFELDPGTSLSITLIRGQAEIFGAELAPEKQYLFGQECKAAVFTWKGCTIQVVGTPSTEYISDETPMAAYANLHIAFEQMRVRALGDDDEEDQQTLSDPPRILLLGPENSGKSTLTKILANYCVRAGQSWSPLLINADMSYGSPAIPGSISATPILSPLPTSSPASPFGSSATSAPTSLSSNALLPLVYWYGHLETKKNPLLMDRILRNMGEAVWARWEGDHIGMLDCCCLILVFIPACQHDARV
jgi:polyribonucleotide 5'-hydroxyl-kinase